jgi:hypothetical protein
MSPKLAAPRIPPIELPQLDASWKRVMTRGTYNLMLKWLSICLLQARVRSFVL